MTLIVQPPTPPHDPTNLTGSNLTSTIILNNILNLVIKMTSSLQAAAAAQAGRLQFMTAWQKAYTDAMNQIHTFVNGNNDFIGGGSSDNATSRDSLNRFNSNMTQVMQNRQSVITDDAKALQSNVQQSNDAVNQQANLGTSILQDMSTLMGTMFH